MWHQVKTSAPIIKVLTSHCLQQTFNMSSFHHIALDQIKEYVASGLGFAFKVVVSHRKEVLLMVKVTYVTLQQHYHSWENKSFHNNNEQPVHLRDTAVFKYNQCLRVQSSMSDINVIWINKFHSLPLAVHVWWMIGIWDVSGLSWWMCIRNTCSILGKIVDCI